METKQNILKTFLQAPIQSQTYLNLIYLLLAFPLGLSYFLFFVIGFSVGIPLSIFVFGLFILAAMFAASWGLTAFERQLTIALLRVKIAPMSSGVPAEAGFWKKLGGFFANPVTWKGLLYLMLKFPIGILSFVITVTGLASTFSLLTAPITYRLWTTNFGFWRIDTLIEALLAVPLGIIVLFITLNIFNLAAYLSGQFARIMLGRLSAAQSEQSSSQAFEKEIGIYSDNEIMGIPETTETEAAEKSKAVNEPSESSPVEITEEGEPKSNEQE